jgi:hypothetical protein
LFPLFLVSLCFDRHPWLHCTHGSIPPVSASAHTAPFPLSRHLRGSVACLLCYTLCSIRAESLLLFAVFLDNAGSDVQPRRLPRPTSSSLRWYVVRPLKSPAQPHANFSSLHFLSLRPSYYQHAAPRTLCCGAPAVFTARCSHARRTLLHQTCCCITRVGAGAC